MVPIILSRSPKSYDRQFLMEMAACLFPTQTPVLSSHCNEMRPCFSISSGLCARVWWLVLASPRCVTHQRCALRPAGGGPRSLMTVCRCREAGRSQFRSPGFSEVILAAQPAVFNWMETKSFVSPSMTFLFFFSVVFWQVEISPACHDVVFPTVSHCQWTQHSLHNKWHQK